MGCCPSNFRVDPLILEPDSPTHPNITVTNISVHLNKTISGEEQSEMLSAPTAKWMNSKEDDEVDFKDTAIVAQQPRESPTGSEVGDDQLKIKDLDTWDKVENYIDLKFSVIKNEDPKTDDLSRPLEKLTQLYKTLSKRDNNDTARMGNYLVTLEVIQTLARFLETPRDDYFEAPLHKNLSGFLTLVWNLTDSSRKICESVVSNGLHTKIIEDFSKPELQVESLKDSEGKQNIRSIGRVKAFFAILYNTLRNFPDCRLEFRKAGVVDICLSFLNTTLLNIKAKALLVLTFAADLDQSAEIIQATETNIRFIIHQLLEGSLNSPSRRGVKYGYNVEELLESLSRLAMNKANALEMVKLNVLQHCQSVLDKNYSVGELKWALELIWSLSFAEEIQSAIKSSEIVPLLLQLKHHENPQISEPAKGILWELKVEKPDSTLIGPESDQSKQGTDESFADRHIMISYCWKQQSKALQIFDRLKANGKNVWIDIQKMEGDSLERMAEAVENAAFVICCLSEEYSNSQACRSEATYAYKQKKKIVFAKVQADFEPKGWLGIILGADIYYHLYDDFNFEQMFMQMMKYIESNSNDHVDAQTEPQLTSSAPKNLISSNRSSEPKKSAFQGWTANETSDWLKKIELTEVATVMLNANGLDGETLFELLMWQRTAPEFFLKFCQSSLKLQQPLDLLKFSAAVRNLK